MLQESAGLRYGEKRMIKGKTVQNNYLSFTIAFTKRNNYLFLSIAHIFSCTPESKHLWPIKMLSHIPKISVHNCIHDIL